MMMVVMMIAYKRVVRFLGSAFETYVIPGCRLVTG
jgi:hypothetical protein